GILELDPELGDAVLELALGIAADETFRLQHIEHATAQRGRRRADDIATAHLGIADTGEHIADRIRKGHLSLLSLPARLDHAGHLPEIAKLTQRNTAHAQLAVVAARAAGNLAAVANAARGGIPRKPGELELRGKALLHRHALVLGQGLELRTLG